MPQLLLFGFIYSAIGFTLMRYSSDGDLALQKKVPLKIKNKEQAWERLTDLTNAVATEVNWNTSVFVAIASTLVILPCYRIIDHSNPRQFSALWILSVLVIFTLQDVVVRWKQAHRKHASAKEQTEIIKMLRWEILK